MMKLFRLGVVLLLLPFISCNLKEEIPIDSYVVMVSFDGFRWDYCDLFNTPNFDAMAEAGVKADRMIPSFPTKTFPNHYALATGLYPDHNGIINNSFDSPDLGGIYRISDRDMVKNPDAYFGEPIWLTAEQQGKKAACFFWVGSEAAVGGSYPTFWKEYDRSIPHMQRVDQVIKWLEMPMHKRPGLITLYFEEPDAIGHYAGPESQATGEVIESLDSILGALRTGIASLDIADRVNLIVLSDHGMGPITRDKYVNILDVVPGEWTDMLVGENPVYLIDPAEGYEDSITLYLDATEGVNAWQKDEIPSRLNYGTSQRFPGIVVVADSLWSIGTKSEPSGYMGGAHGYDNAFTDMHAIFLAEGPAFKKDYVSDPFSNVEVYGIIAHILGLVPAQTDGDISNVSDLFAD
ncbi:MAG: alkaline phosphatase family protein [Bacteroidetes bacterium]|nr:alkaline phosphatase family protein [Bacteroidota bacterium]